MFIDFLDISLDYVIMVLMYLLNCVSVKNLPDKIEFLFTDKLELGIPLPIVVNGGCWYRGYPKC